MTATATTTTTGTGTATVTATATATATRTHQSRDNGDDDVVDNREDNREVRSAAELGRLFLLLERQLFADARPCPFCSADDEPNANVDEASGVLELERLPHARDCDLDRTLRDAGLRV